MYFPEAGKINTPKTEELVLAKAKELGIKHVVVASCSGETALKFLDKGLNVVCVTHHVGFAGPGIDEMDPENRAMLEKGGCKILTTTHLLAGVDRSLKNKFGGIYPAEIMGFTLRLFGQGVKVSIEIASMALDAGLIPYGEEVIAVGGTAEGADAAIVVTPAHSNNFFETKVHEIICKPRNW
ncbi:hypothetical protein BR63_06805 [Thermanaerosceptrum fracticalcis]|uniref:Pyruvate kinase C-terminal domain-containing protein n=1 Tax=Thermanaerosceptrum fracticalcis TaxID=1712410 RepID=A0A7G6E1U8_THEFR|nr:pyruvate kinase alpha/beta domain-containing protein [Thermanaerosceptrum fracticalcis]QNB46052.1 hypothetical protein BR63_06805 [Thermanaerosceptrum fracticalcis]